jgi:GH15 family glucan-1,4-alpha-glucosidase
MQLKQPPIKDLAIIGDKRTCALIDKEGTVAWYCPWRFDQPSLFSLLIDKDGGWWGVEAQGKTFVNRQYQGNSAILTSDFSVDGGSFSITDFMPMSSDIHGICRIFSPSPVDITSRLFLTPDYNRSSASLKKGDDGKTVLCKQFEFYIKASHPVTVNHDTIEYTIPAGENGWAVLVEDEKMLASISSESLEQALQQTESKWKQIMNNLSYEGSYKEQMYQSYKAIQLVTHEYSGGILAAGTTSLPEQIGSVRNYDYRFV